MKKIIQLVSILLLLQCIMLHAFAQKHCRMHVANAKEYIKNDSLTLALIELDSATDKSSNFAKAYYLKGEIWELKNNYRRAIGQYSLAILYNPNFTSAYLKRAALHFNLKDHRDYVLNDINEAIATDPKNASLYALKAFYYAHTVSPIDSKRDFTNALKAINTAIDLRPDEASHFHDRSEFRFKENQKLSALADINLALEKDKTNDEFYHFRGVIKFTMGDYRSSLNDVTRAIDLNSSEYSYYQLRGNVYYNLTKYDLAYVDYSTTINLIFKKIAQLNKKLSPEDQLNISLRETHLLRGMALVQESKPYDGCEDFKKAMRMGDSKAGNYTRKYCN